MKCLQYKIDDMWRYLMSDGVIIVPCFVIFYLISQFFKDLPSPVWIVRGFAFQIRECSFPNWTKV